MENSTVLEGLQVEWPEWHFWETNAGTVMASYHRSLSVAELRAGMAQTLPYGANASPEELQRQLRDQQRRGRRFRLAQKLQALPKTRRDVA